MHFATISSKGQLVIPSQIREKYRLKAGTRVGVADSNGQITITPNPPDPYHGLPAMRGILSHVEEDVEAWFHAERRKDREREDAR